MDESASDFTGNARKRRSRLLVLLAAIWLLSEACCTGHAGMRRFVCTGPSHGTPKIDFQANDLSAVPCADKGDPLSDDERMVQTDPEIEVDMDQNFKMVRIFSFFGLHSFFRRRPTRLGRSG